MDANFFYYSINMIDLYKDNHVRACVRVCVCVFVNFFFEKTSPQKLLTGLLPNFIVVFLRYRLKSSLHRNRKKSGLWSDTGAQTPLGSFLKLLSINLKPLHLFRRETIITSLFKALRKKSTNNFKIDIKGISCRLEIIYYISINPYLSSNKNF